MTMDQATSFVPTPGVPGSPAPLVPVVPGPAGSDPLEAVEAKLERITRLLEEQEERYRDLQEVVADMMPAVNGVLRQAARKLDALEQSGALHALPLAGRFWGRVRDPRGVKPMGPFAAVKALRDPDIGRGVALLLELLRGLGAAARESDVSAAAGNGTVASRDRRSE